MATPLNLTAKSAPGVYTSISNQSYTPPQNSAYTPGLVGVARKGPFSTPTAVTSVAGYVAAFGTSLGGQFYMASTVALLTNLTNQVNIVRVGNQYTPVSSVTVTGSSGGSTLFAKTGNAQIFSPAGAPYGQGVPVYLQITQTGFPSTVNVPVASASSGTIALAAGYVLASSYGTNANGSLNSGASVAFSNFADAANSAEGVLYAYTYGSNAAQQTDAQLPGSPYVTGTKGAYQFTCSIPGAVVAGNLIKIKGPASSGIQTTEEVLVKATWPDGTVFLEPTTRQDIGYQPLPLQDTYGIGSSIYLATGKVPYLYLQSTSAGDWANGNDPTTGLYVKVRPGSAQDTKKLEIWVNNALAETIDNVTNNPADTTNFYSIRIGTLASPVSQNIAVAAWFNPAGTTLSAANTSNGWLSAVTTLGAINAGGALSVNSPTAGTEPIESDTGGGFHLGYNGENAQPSDFIGAYNPTTDSYSGVQSFLNTDFIQVNSLCCPGVTDTSGASTGSFAIHQMLAVVAARINAVAIADVPDLLTLYQAVDWQNGAGTYNYRQRLNTPNMEYGWNWLSIVDPFSQQTVWFPPSYGVLRCEAFAWNNYQPWYAAAGDTRGLIPEALSVRYTSVSDAARQASYGNGQSINPILMQQGTVKLFGERTQAVAESELSVVHNVHLVNYIVTNLAIIFHPFIFEPNDAELLGRIDLAGTAFMNTVQNGQGVQQYQLTIDNTNNTATTQNLREVIVDLSIIPTETAERIYINCTVYAAGATLNSVTTSNSNLTTS